MLGLTEESRLSAMNSTPPPPEPTPLIAILRRLLDGRAPQVLKNPKISQGELGMWSMGVRSQLEKIYGKGAAQAADFGPVPKDLSPDALRELMVRRVEHLQRMVQILEALPSTTRTPLLGKKVFIGHGRSPLWRELKDFLADRLGLPWEEFNRTPVAGVTTSERLSAMLSESGFAFLVLTAEEERADATVHARANVIHEVGLFQGVLGLRRAIVLLEDGCTEFSNIAGLSHISFPRGDISARFEEVRRVLERENLV